MKNMKISRKLIFSFLIVIALTIVVGVVGIFGLVQINAAADELYETQTLPLVELSYSREFFQRLRSEQRNLVMTQGDQGWINDIEAAIANQEDELRTRLLTFSETIITVEEQTAYDEALQGLDSYMSQMRDIVVAARAELPQEELLAMMRAATPAANMVGDNLATMMYERTDEAEVVWINSNTLYTTLMIAIIIIIVIAIIISLVLALYISGLISKPIVSLTSFMKTAAVTGDIVFHDEENAMVAKYAKNKDEIGQLIDSTAEFIHEINVEMDMLEKVGDGDLSIVPNVLSDRDKIGKALTRVVDRLNSMFNEIKSATAQVSAGSKQIAEGAQSLAQGSTEQAASVEQLSASIAEISQKTRNNATMAEKAAMLANEIKISAEKGSNQMDEMMVAVKDINASSQNISKVIKSIDDIAFQTNILALNAAVEAARAGQHGKGFAVVAEEVRNLAAKSAEAAKDTEALIADSIEKAELGSRIADDTAASLTEIVTGIGESSQIVSEIAKSSEEQNNGIDQINQGIDQVSQVTQQNSATAQESAASSEEMSGQSDMLEELISRFRLKDDVGYMRLPTAPQYSGAPKPTPVAAPKHQPIAQPTKPTIEEPTEFNNMGKY